MSAGFFGPRHDPYVVQTRPGQPIPNLATFRTVDARRVVGPPVTVADLFTTLLSRLGIDPGTMDTANDRPLTLADKGRILRELTG